MSTVCTDLIYVCLEAECSVSGMHASWANISASHILCWGYFCGVLSKKAWMSLLSRPLIEVFSNKICLCVSPFMLRKQYQGEANNDTWYVCEYTCE